MIQIKDTIVSFELFNRYFCCDLDSCKGICCIDGDSGAPLEENEVVELEKVLPIIWPILPEKSKHVIEKQGVSYIDADGDRVTSIVNKEECVFSFIDENGICKCALEKAFNDGKISFYKPISCHLYPIRITKYKQFTAVNYHRWQICNCAEILGMQKKIPAYRFLKVPLIRKFGEAWYKELEEAATLYEIEKNKHQ